MARIERIRILIVTMKPITLTNYHSHSLYCDGRASMETFVRFALSRGFTSYGFSSHAPLPFPTAWTMDGDRMDDYFDEFRRLKQKYANRIELYIGLEIDYLSEEHNPASAYFRRLPLDYRIGSVHLLRDEQGQVVDADLPADKFRQMIAYHFSGDVKSAVQQYYQRSLRMIEQGGFDIVGHADKIHYNASYCRPGILDEPWYDQLVCGYFQEIARRGYQMEINTKAYSDLGVFYPHERYFPLLHDLGIQVQVNTDAHYPDRIDSGRTQALHALKRAGYDQVMELHEGHWCERSL